jgi:two-component system sporulation sensor kinase B
MGSALYFVANYLLVKTYFRAQSPRQRNDAYCTCVIIMPISLLDLLINYFLPGFGIDLDALNSYLIIILFISFSCIVTRYGFLGRKLQIEKLHLDNSIKTMTSGTAILNHSIKNEIAKISICASNLNKVGRNIDQAKESAQIIIRTIEHILKMIERTSEYTKDFTLDKHPIYLKDFLVEILAEYQFQFREKKIKVTTDFDLGVWISADTLHLREVINNLIKNAIEAMDNGGNLELKVTKSKGLVIISIKDTGSGISGELLPHVFKPFFTTKNPKRNFGLGLLYCYQVLNKHGGKIKIESEPEKGTAIYLSFPSKSRINRRLLPKGASYVPN